jgi:hypothetical protein
VALWAKFEKTNCVGNVSKLVGQQVLGVPPAVLARSFTGSFVANAFHRLKDLKTS